jgi:serine/threonine protein kinase/Flp pilus assembly protein TadD
MDNLIGQSVAHYAVLRQLGRGGMGVVYEARDTRLGRSVALKFLPPQLAQDTAALERFQREARAASALNHPNICTVYAIDQHERQHFIVMELLEGRPLSELMRHEPFPIDQLLAIGTQMADALESAHSKGIVHRDIKPANVFISPRGQVKILDFGLAKMESLGVDVSGDPSQLATMVHRDELTSPGTTMGTVSYMSPEQARGQLADARTDLFSLGAVLYQMATGMVPFPGDTSAVVFDAMLNRDPAPATELNPALPQEFGRILEKALEKDRTMRYQSATDLKTDLTRLKRSLDSGTRRTVEGSDARVRGAKAAEKSVAVLFFENLSGVKEDEYFRDGITEDIITELSKIRGLNIFSRPTVLAYRDRPVTPAQIGQQLGAAYVLAGSVRRAGSRLRINAQLIDTHTDFPIWSERYDREMQDVFELQDEIARKIAEALRVTLSPQEQEALAAKPTANLQAYDLFLRGKSYARRRTRQDFEFALQMFEHAVTLDPAFALAYAGMAIACAQIHYNHGRDPVWMERAVAAAEKAKALQPSLPEAHVAYAWVLYAAGQNDEAVRLVREAIERKHDAETAYYLLCRALFAAGRYQEVSDIAETALVWSADDYNVYVPIVNALGALGKTDLRRNIQQRRTLTLEAHLAKVPEDARARMQLGIDFANSGRPDDALREIKLGMLLRPDDANVLYNAACGYCMLNERERALDALRKAWAAGFKDAMWARRDPDLNLLHGDPLFEQLYPDASPTAGA